MEDNNERFTLESTMDYIKNYLGIDKFDLDVAASDQSHKADEYFTKETNGLANRWHGNNVFCNPPFDDIESWVRKAWSEHDYRAIKVFSSAYDKDSVICMIVPANRTEQKWWQELVEPYRDSHGINGYDFKTHFIPKRVKFGTPEDPMGVRKGNSPKFGCVLLIWKINGRQQTGRDGVGETDGRSPDRLW